MKSIIMLAAAGALTLLVSGCRPELDQSGLSPEEQAWAKNIKANYGAWEVPESVPRSVRRDDLNTAAASTESTLPPAAEAPAADAPAVDPVAPDTRAATAPNAAPEAVAPVVAAEEPAAAAPAAPETYTVVKGDTLGGIARKFYGKASAWKRIQEANADLLKGKTVIRPGMKLQIPRP